MALDLNEQTKIDFLSYANSVIKSRAIPRVEDNLKPIHRKILYTFYLTKLTSDKEAKKSMATVGEVLKLSPHGDVAAYEALVRLAQWWKIRYPLVEMQGNTGNILGDKAAAARYTNAKLSVFGDLMLSGIDEDAVDFKLNYDESMEEPVTLPSKFPYLLCGNNSGIAVGMSSDLVSHNFTEVAEAIKYYIEHKDCSIADLMRYIKGPDFPTAGKIINGDDLLNIYTTGRGAIKVQPHYDIAKQGNKTLLIFHDIPYGVDIDSGIKLPLHKLVIEDGYEEFEDINIKKVGPQNFDIIITLSKNADVAKSLNVLFTKTGLADTVKINQTLIINGEPKILNLKQMIQYWVDYRSNIIKRVAQNQYGKTNHKLTVTLGLQKCMSNIDLLVNLIRNSDNKMAAKIAIMKEFELNDEQADAVLDMKLSRLSKLDLTELNDTQKELEEQLAKLRRTIEDEQTRYTIILDDLKEIKKIIGKDERLTEIVHYRPEAAGNDAPIMKQEWFIYPTGLGAAKVGSNGVALDEGLLNSVMAYKVEDIWGYNKEGEISPIVDPKTPLIGAFVKDDKHNKVVSVTKNGNIKVSDLNEFKFKKIEKVIKLKDNDELIYTASCSDENYIMLFNGTNILKLAIKDLPIASKLTVGVKSGFDNIISAFIVKDGDTVLSVTKDNKGKLTSVNDFTVDSRGNKGQLVAENTMWFRYFEQGRESFYIQPKQGKIFAVSKDKVSLKSRTAVGANISNRNIVNII